MPGKLSWLLFALIGASACAQPPERVRLGEGNLLKGIPGEGPLDLAQVEAWLADPANHRELRPELPLGMDAGSADIKGLEENPLTRAKIELGRQLFFDPRLSRDGTVSCASCHDPQHGYAMPTRYAVGVDGQEGNRNSPTAANRILSGAQFWDGRAASLEEQAAGPMANPVEMGSTHEAVVDALRKVPGYVAQFEKVFEALPSGERGVTIENAGRAIAAFERAVVSGPCAWDLHDRIETLRAAGVEDDPELEAELAELEKKAETRPLSESAQRGAKLFFSARTGCTQCHAGANFTDERYHNLGVGMESLADGDASDTDWGRYAVTGDDADRGAFKTPSLRNVADTAPYLHDGSADTLEEVVALYVEGGVDNPRLSPLAAPLDLSAEEQADLVAFLTALGGDWPEVETKRLPE